MINLTLTVNQTITLTMNPQSFSGKVGRVKTITWKVISGESTIKPSVDGMTAIITASSTPGVTVFLVGADTDMNLKTARKWVNIDLHQSATVNADGFIYNQISVNVVQTLPDKSQDRTTTNLGLSAGAPRD